MKIAVVAPDSTSWPKYNWVSEAFERLDHQVSRVRSFEALRQADKECQLVVFGQKGAGVNVADVVNLSKERRAKWVSWWFDLIFDAPGLSFERQPLIRTFREWMSVMDACFIKERSMIQDYQRLGINAVWLDQGCPSNLPAVTDFGPAEKKWDILVPGKLIYHARRKDVAALVKVGCKVLWLSHPFGEPMEGVETQNYVEAFELPKVASQCHAILGSDLTTEVDGFWSDRLWLACGMGANFIKRASVGQPGGYYFSYSTTDELIELAAGISEGVLGKGFGEASRAWVMAKHTYERRCEEMLNFLGMS